MYGLDRMSYIPGGSSWGHLCLLRHSCGLLADDCEARFRSLVSGTPQYTEDKISSAEEQPAPKGRPENTIKAASIARVTTPKNI